LNERSRSLNEEEWNFTKIEERLGSTPRTGSPIDHYERLPCLDASPEHVVPDHNEEKILGGSGSGQDASSVYTTRSEMVRTVEVHSNQSSEDKARTLGKYYCNSNEVVL